jgi:hypothetical protein
MTENTRSITTRLGSDNLLLFSFALAKLALHLVTNVFDSYGYFRDELYYIACSDHLDFGYVDQPPFSIILLKFSRLLFGDSLFALRLLPAIVGSATVFVTGLIARELGGKRYAQALAALAAVVSLGNIASASYYSMNCYDLLLWALAAYFTARLINTSEPTYWLAIGIAIGLGLINKIGTSWFACGLFVGFLLTSHRSWFKTRWPYLAGGIAFLLFLPYIVWNLTHDLAHLEFIRNATGDKYASLTWLSFVLGQIPVQNPVTLPLWLVGIVFFFTQRGTRYRPLIIAYLIALLILIVNQHSKPEYLSSAYVILFAGGGVFVENLAARKNLLRLRPAFVILLVAGLFLAPVVLPILPVEQYIRYSEWMGIKPSSSEAKRLDKLPQFYADRFGWDTMAATVARVYHTLPPEDQDRCGIFTQNYGEAGAIDFFGKRYGLPGAISGHNNYWLWGPNYFKGQSVWIVIGGRREDHLRSMETAVPSDTIRHPYAMPYENDRVVFVCRNPKMPLEEIWKRTKSYN